MQMGFTAGTHFLLILSYSHNASEVTAGQRRQSYRSKQINIPRVPARASLEDYSVAGGERRAQPDLGAKSIW